VLRGGIESSIPQAEYGQDFDPVFFESAPGIVVTGSDVASGAARASNGVLEVNSRAAQAAQGGTLHVFGTTAEARAYAEFVLDDVVVTPLGPGAPPFVPAVFRFALDGLLPDPVAQGSIFDTFLATNFPNEIFAGAETELVLRVSLKDALGQLISTEGGTARLRTEASHAAGSMSAPPLLSGAFAGKEAAMRSGAPFLVEVGFVGVPVGEDLALAVSLEAHSRSVYGFPVNGGLWQSAADVVFDSTATFARDFVAVLPAGVTLHSASGGIVDNVWTLPEPGGASLPSVAALLAVALRSRCARAGRARSPADPGARSSR
jgi:hypothetical protein